jgi:hypothetical protein
MASDATVIVQMCTQSIIAISGGRLAVCAGYVGSSMRNVLLVTVVSLVTFVAACSKKEGGGDPKKYDELCFAAANLVMEIGQDLEKEKFNKLVRDGVGACALACDKGEKTSCDMGNELAEVFCKDGACAELCTSATGSLKATCAAFAK